LALIHVSKLIRLPERIVENRDAAIDHDSDSGGIHP